MVADIELIIDNGKLRMGGWVNGKIGESVNEWMRLCVVDNLLPTFFKKRNFNFLYKIAF